MERGRGIGSSLASVGYKVINERGYIYIYLPEARGPK